MTKKKIAREKRDWTANLRLLPGLACLALLAGCGGGGSGSDTATAQDATKQIAAAVPGSWTGRVPGSEVINGITVPPEPSPTLNNATLAGVDANKNGVRDDVEREIARKIKNKLLFPNSIAYSAIYQKMVVASSPQTRSEAISILKQLMCSAGGADLTSSLIKELVFSKINLREITGNTSQRKFKIDAIDTLVGAYDGEELLCD